MDRYFLTQRADGVEVEVTKAQFVNAERNAGFRNTLGRPDEPGTAGWSSTREHLYYDKGRIEYDFDARRAEDRPA